jgi:outer membrane lipoprotein carrier protein
MGLRLRLLISLGCAALAGSGARADTTNALQQYLNGLHSLRTEFTQTVTDAKGQELEHGSGVLVIERPDRFRWAYTPQSGDANSTQLLVADGKNLWFLDQDLAQATVKPQSEALSATPVVLLSGTDEELKSAFSIDGAPPRDGLQWVVVTPRSASAEFSRAQLGFQGSQLLTMLVDDRLGQTVRLSFSNSERNPALHSSTFQFTLPKGVDLIGTPRT